MKRFFKRLSVFLMSMIFVQAAFTQSGPSYSSVKANQRTALRCLSIAKDYVAQGDWSSSASQIQLGLSYDDSVSDLWYVLAISKNHLGEYRSVVLPLVEKSLQLNHWVDYNRDSARILYADILCDTGRFSEVLSILDSKPLLYSADAEYIRAKALYRLNTEESVSKARAKIDSARKIYPEDKRFPLLFFMFENPFDETSEVKKLSSYFISRISQYAAAAPDRDAELEIRAASFAEGEECERMLKSFKARGLKNPLYPAAALRAGLLTQEEAFNEFCSYADETIDYSAVCDFVSLLTEENVVEKASVYWNAYDGTVIQDTDGDLITNMKVEYSRGRPERISYDRNQDGLFDWILECDFGVPVKGTLLEHGLELYWNTYPYLGEADYKGKDNENLLSFNLVGETLSWSPVQILSDEIISSVCPQFFYPVLPEEEKYITDEMLISSCSSYVIPTREKEGASIKFTILDGKVLLAQYYLDSKMYAQAEFRNGFPDFRIVDADGDGIFETTEFYGFDRTGSMKVHSLEDEKSIMTNLFGLPAEGGGFYLRMVQIDQNGDTVPDFTEEYLSDNGKISSWDTNGDGLWDIRNVDYGYKNGNTGHVTDDMFYEGPEENLVTVTCIDGIPVRVIDGEESLDVTPDSLFDFYWIGETGESDTAMAALKALSELENIGECLVVQTKRQRALCVRVGTKSYGKIIHELDAVDENQNEDSSESGSNNEN